MSNLHYERLCLLFNIGVLQGQIAAAQNFQSDEGLKTAAKMFQVSDRWSMIPNFYLSVKSHYLRTSRKRPPLLGDHVPLWHLGLSLIMKLHVDHYFWNPVDANHLLAF